MILAHAGVGKSINSATDDRCSLKNLEECVHFGTASDDRFEHFLKEDVFIEFQCQV